LSDLAISSKEIRPWLERETKSTFIPVHSKARKMTDELRETLEGLEDASKMLYDNSSKEIEKRNMKTYKRARALNKLSRLFLERIRKISIPEKVSYGSLCDLVQASQKAFMTTEVDVRKWFPRISPFFILDRRKFLLTFEKSKEFLKEAQDFLDKEYVKTRTFEQTFELIDNILTLQQELERLREQKAEIQGEKASVERQISHVKQRLTDLRSEESISQLTETRKEISELDKEVRHRLRHLEKPFLKLQSLASRNGGTGLAPEEADKLSQYVDNPFKAFSTEETGHPVLRQILIKLDGLISSGKLKLKTDKARKAQQDIDDIVNKNSLTHLHQKCRNATSLKTELSTSQEVAEIHEDLSKLQRQVKDLTIKRESIEMDEDSVKKNIDETLQKIRNQKNQITENIHSFTGKNVLIE
jgi:predicted  nucleic acid-binding Zn-ribbon protein